jgi:rare lipoprotein A
MRCVHFGILLTLAAGVALAGCSGSKSSKQASMDPFAGTGSPYFKGSGKMPKGTGREHVGRPYQVAGRWFTPKEQPGYDKTGTASWYGEAFHRRKTSNGEWFDMNDLTAAHATLPLPSYAKVTNQENGRTIIVRINDRGPFVGPRIMDLSKRSAEVLGFKNQGKATVRVQYLGPAPLRDQGQHLMAMNRELGQGASMAELTSMARGYDTGGTQIAQAEAPEPPRLRTVRYDEDNAQAADDVPMGYVITVGTFADPENAAAATNSLAQFGARMASVQSGKGLYYRVLIGPISNRNDVRDALQEVNDAGFLDARVVSTRLQQVSAN